jgi:hypothetical protein
MNTMSAPMLTSRSATATVTPTCGTNVSAPLADEWIVRRTRRV